MNAERMSCCCLWGLLQPVSSWIIYFSQNFLNLPYNIWVSVTSNQKSLGQHSCPSYQWDPSRWQPLSVTELLGRWGQTWTLQTCRPEPRSPNRSGEREEGGSTNSSDEEVVACSSTFWAKVNLVNQVLGCILQTGKDCTCPASRWKKEPRVSKGDINRLMEGGSKVLERHPTVCGRRWAEHGSSLRSQGGRGDCQLQVNWRQVGSSVTRETSRGARPSPPLW